MGTFKDFIKEDISAKTLLVTAMPIKTKKQQTALNKKVDEINKTYTKYKEAVNKYIEVKAKSFAIKEVDKNIKEVRDKIFTLEHTRFILNPTNTFFEKTSFDNLLYQISNYNDFDFQFLNGVIDQFINKFEEAGIKLDEKDFDYTCYVNDYMKEFLASREKKNIDSKKLSNTFEKIYWVNPELIEHIELNFRKLIKKYERKFNHYINMLSKSIKEKNNVKDYEDCLDKLKDIYNDLNIKTGEDINDIIYLAKEGEIDITTYFEDNKLRASTFEELMIDHVDLNNEAAKEDFYQNLKKLKVNLEEYSNYIRFLPLIQNFKKEYEGELKNDGKVSDLSTLKKKIKNLEKQIAKNEAKLEKTNRKINGNILNMKDEIVAKQLKMESVRQAQKLFEQYKELDTETFRYKTLSILTRTLTISELLNLYYSFDYFKKVTFEKLFDIATNDDMVKYGDEFDDFAVNPTNIIVTGIPLFGEENIAKIIANKHRLNNINITEEMLNPDDIETLLGKIQMILRIIDIERSATTVEKIWFMVEANKISQKESKK